MAITSAYLSEVLHGSYAGVVVPIILASTAWKIEKVMQNVVAPWVMYIFILLSWVLLLSMASLISPSGSAGPTAKERSYEEPDVSYDAVHGYYDDGCPRSRCLHNTWPDYSPNLNADCPQSGGGDGEQKPLSIWDGKVDFSCTSSEADLLPRDSVTQNGILGWQIRMIMHRQNTHQKQSLENLKKQNRPTSGFPPFQDWPQDPSLTYRQNWDRWYDARAEYRRLNPPSEEELAEERRRGQEQAEKIENWWYEKRGLPRPQRPQVPIMICVVSEGGMPDRVIFDVDGPERVDDSWRGIEVGHKEPIIDEEFLWPHWRPRNASGDAAEGTMVDDMEDFEGLWAGFPDGQYDEHHEWTEDDFETY
ncbi:hypothetical protein QBC40DRAFT_322436 [Triangularia verruculosa]|uniref:Uncharacterized protein n=1 Tax=Triangularia verruculosa TaxID=2587418 RepID=A0AAN6XMZ8_9PEZI|nr:hypothetical protein QBC40DRAFT_322436 [Triangularia verruculosa]